MPRGIYIRTEENRKNLSRIAKRRLRSKESGRKISKALKGHSVSEKTKRKIAKSLEGVPKSKKMRRKRTKAQKKLWQNPEYRKKMCKLIKERSFRQRQQWQNPEYKEKQLKAMLAGCNTKSTEPEKKLRRELNKLFPREYEYVGNRTFWIGYYNPDFININNQKKIIELFGDYWHSEELQGRTKTQEENQRIKHFTKYGYKTLIIWQKEIKDILRLRRKLVQFHNKLN